MGKNKNKNKKTINNSIVKNNITNINDADDNDKNKINEVVLSDDKNMLSDNKLSHNIVMMNMSITYTEEITIEKYEKLKLENISLQARLNQRELDYQNELNKKNLKIDNLEKEIDRLELDNKELRKKIKILEDKLEQQETEIKSLKDKNEKFEAYVKINECNTIVNNNFQREYKKWFKPKYSDHIPNIGRFIKYPPDKNDDKDAYEFWQHFVKQFPKSDDIRFQNLYIDISNKRANSAHVDVSALSPHEFDNLAKIAFDNYNDNKKLYDEYRDWLFSFS